MARPKSKEPKQRLNIELSVATRESLQSIQAKTQADSLSEVVRKAIEVYQFIVDVKSMGDNIYIQDHQTGERKEIIVL